MIIPISPKYVSLSLKNPALFKIQSAFTSATTITITATTTSTTTA